MYGEDFEAGGKYEDLEQTYSVNILGFKYLDYTEYHSSYSIREDKRYEKLTDKLSIHIFELPKVPKDLIISDHKQMWMELIKADSEEALEMVRTTWQSQDRRAEQRGNWRHLPALSGMAFSQSPMLPGD